MSNNQPSNRPHARGCDLSKVPKAADVAPVDLKVILGVDSSNSFLRALRIQQGFLKAVDLPVELRTKVPPMAPVITVKGLPK